MCCAPTYEMDAHDLLLWSVADHLVLRDGLLSWSSLCANRDREWKKEQDGECIICQIAFYVSG